MKIKHIRCIAIVLKILAIAMCLLNIIISPFLFVHFVIFGILLYLCIESCVKCIGLLRLNSVIKRLKPDLLKEELDCLYPTSLGKRSAYYLYCQAIWLDQIGEYQKALENVLKAKFLFPLNARRKISSLLYFYVRIGDLAGADALFPSCEGMRYIGDVNISHLHTLGLYHLKKGDTTKARQYFTRIDQKKASQYALLNLYYDGGQLEEMEGNNEKAIGIFKKAAALGPKTWMGQEAARRAEALAAGGK